MQELSKVSDDDLLQGLHGLAGCQREVMAELVLHLAEVDARRLYANKGFPSLFSYCLEELSFSEDEACRRIEAARLARKVPAIYELLKTGAVTLTVLGLLKPHLTPDNHTELFAGVSGASVRQAKEWLATRFPQPDVPWSIRKQPERPRVTRESLSATQGVHVPAIPGQLAPPPALTQAIPDQAPPPALAQAIPDQVSTPPALTQAIPDQAPPPSLTHSTPNQEATPLPEPRRGLVEPLSRDRFLVKLTVSRTVRDKLELARDLVSHRNPSRDLAVVVDRALDALLEKLERTKLGRASRADRKRRPAKRTHVANETRREVVARDGLGCSFVAPNGYRCGARAFLEFDHEIPKGRGGDSEPNNVRLLCRAHNLFVAERIYGTAPMRRAVSVARPTS